MSESQIFKEEDKIESNIKHAINNEDTGINEQAINQMDIEKNVKENLNEASDNKQADELFNSDLINTSNTICNSMVEYEKINKKISQLAELIETNYEKNKIKLLKNQNTNEEIFVDSLPEQNKFINKIFNPNDIQSIKSQNLYLNNFQSKKYSEFFDNNEQQGNEKVNGNELIDIDEILEMEVDNHYDKKIKNSQEKKPSTSHLQETLSEEAFQKGFSIKFSNDKKRINFENCLVSSLSSLSQMLWSGNDLLLSNCYINKNNAIYNYECKYQDYDCFYENINKKMFLLKKRFHNISTDKPKGKTLTNSNNKAFNNGQFTNVEQALEIDMENKLQKPEYKIPKEDIEIVDENDIHDDEMTNFNSGKEKRKQTDSLDLSMNENSLALKAFSLKKMNLFYENFKKFCEEINDPEFDRKMREDIFYNKSILTNKFLKYHKDKAKITEVYNSVSYNHLKIKMRDNTAFKHNRVNTGINTMNIENETNSNARTAITTLNQLLNSLRSNNRHIYNSDDYQMFDMDEDFSDDFDMEHDNQHENEHEHEHEHEHEENSDMEDEQENINENESEEHTSEHEGESEDGNHLQ